MRKRPATALPHTFRSALTVGALTLVALCSGCRTPGKLHAYLLPDAVPGTRAEADAIQVLDVNPDTGARLATVPTGAAAGEKVIGIAYDPFTDHFYLRLFPGNRVRVVDRPAASVKREFTFAAPPIPSHDLALRQHDRHLFFTDPTGPALFETSIYGAIHRRIILNGLDAPAWGLACDERTDGFLILPAETCDRVLRFTVRGEPAGEIQLARAVHGYSLAYDSERRELFAELADSSGVGVFGTDGHLRRTLPSPATPVPSERQPAQIHVLMDVGPRSLIRIF